MQNFFKNALSKIITVFIFISITFSGIVIGAVFDKTGTLWAPYVEWEIDNPSYSGNPFDLISTVTFTHADSDAKHTTEMFYAGGTKWKFRFAGTKTGDWSFSTSSTDSDLNGHTGSVAISPNTNPDIKGFMTKSGNNWAREVDDLGVIEAFVPQFRMAFTEDPTDWSSAKIDIEIDTHMNKEGFNALFFFVGGRWVDINISGAKFTNSNPDPKTFDVLESLIVKAHSAGGVIHLWYSGDCSRSQCVQAGFGTNGARSDGEKRLLRYIGARLAPLPGWIMGYGFDIVEDTTTDDLRGWGNYLRSKMGWKHLLGARDQSDSYTYTYWPEADWYSKGNYFNGASYNDVVGVYESDVSVPHAFDERWWTSRLDENGLRRQLWNNMMAGGVSAIWGATGPWESDPYVNPNWFKTYFTFWKNRTISGLTRDNSLSSGKVLRAEDFSNYVFYAENASSLTYNLTNSTQSLPVVAIDAKGAYSEISLGLKDAKAHTWAAPYTSDWVIAVGNFDRAAVVAEIPSAPTGQTLQKTIK